MKKTIGVDIGGQTTKLGIVDNHGIIQSWSTISSLQPNLDTYINDLTSAISELIDNNGGPENIKGIGIGAPNGNYYRGSIEYAPNLTWSKDSQGQPLIINLSQLIYDKLGINATITNDANAAACGEMIYGIAKGMKNFIMLTLGTGVGSGIVINGNVIYGHDGFAGELGHTTIIRDGRQCNCGLKGCLETYTSATGVARTAREFLSKSDTPSLLRDCNFENISSKDVYDAAKLGDNISIEIFKYTGNLLGAAIANFVPFSSPEAIILFGGLTNSREFLEQSIIDSMNENLLPIWKNKIKLLYSGLKDSDAAILGASSLAWTN